MDERRQHWVGLHRPSGSGLPVVELLSGVAAAGRRQSKVIFVKRFCYNQPVAEVGLSAEEGG